eukprot:CAMPEP_0201539730 /NCGR_PEP_ID=MMETSP0161_2-20130828/70562_1 /ASSEMBLY_ACC=CAM_ASM_000251 /TAXON_ID=180227 /ORGANISM="Neoparamoeba aestuarina, Strain SoJaBio B1-5/56/2" /LENGTH=46 /DNA_ID= /DNA_START= /DNA_END= /DNA_ORIENTATION=
MAGIGCLQMLEKGNDHVKETLRQKTSRFVDRSQPTDNEEEGDPPPP